MSLSLEQHKYLSKYLKDVGIEHQEPFEEFYDHIATGFQESCSTDIEYYVRNVAQPSFGGVKGMLSVVKEQNNIRKTLIFKRAKAIFLGLFGWPTVLIVLASFSFVQIGIKQFGQQFIIIFTLSMGLVVPALIVFYGMTKFYLSCKKAKLPYTSNNLNNWLLSLLHLPFALLNVAGNLVVPIVFGRETFKEFLNSYPVVTITLSTFMILFGITYLKLIREKFIFKLEKA